MPSEGRHLFVFIPGDSSVPRPRCQFGMQESGRYGAHVTYPISGMHWRHAVTRYYQLTIPTDMALAHFTEAAKLPQIFPDECLDNSLLYSDGSQRGNGITRDAKTHTTCLTMGICDTNGQWQCYYSFRANSSPLFGSRVLTFVFDSLAHMDVRLRDLGLTKR